MEASQPLVENEASGSSEEADNFYEEIEAPKFVDFTVADRYRPDDRYWFCMRVGCDQKHEEELDPEKISQDFVLRVMAARSPNVRLRKALNRNVLSSNMKGPLSAPAKPSWPRLSRPPVVSSISKKLFDDAQVKARPLSKHVSVVNTKPKPPTACAKSLTTPRNKKCQPSLRPFGSAHNPKPVTTELPGNRAVTKALVFKSPKKVVRTKISQELNTPATKICKGIKRLEISGQRKQSSQHIRKKLSREIKRDYNKPWSLNTAKQSRFCKVKNQTDGSSQKCKDDEVRGILHQNKLIKKQKESLRECDNSDSNDITELENDERLRVQSLEVLSQTNATEHHEGKLESSKIIQSGNSGFINCNQEATSTSEMVTEIKSSVISDAFKADLNQSSFEAKNLVDNNKPKTRAPGEEGKEASVPEEKLKVLYEEKASDDPFPESETVKEAYHETEATEHDDKENNLPLDQENTSVSEDNRGLNGREVFGSQDTCRNIQKVTKQQNKSFKDSAVIMMYKRPKPTNPKPFRLRTDERGILKESILERRLQDVTYQKETATATGFLGATHHSRQPSELLRERSGSGHCESGGRVHLTATRRNLRTRSKQENRVMTTNISKGLMQQKVCTTLQTTDMKICRKSTFVQLGHGKNIDASTKSENNIKNRKRVSAAASRPKITSKLSECRTTQTTNALRPCFREATVAKEPKFHRVHIPRSCTKNLN